MYPGSIDNTRRLRNAQKLAILLVKQGASIHTFQELQKSGRSADQLIAAYGLIELYTGALALLSGPHDDGMDVQRQWHTLIAMN